jgi:hypothetical protein
MRLTGIDRQTLEKRLVTVTSWMDGRIRLYRLADAIHELTRGQTERSRVSLEAARTEAELARAEKTRMEIDTAKGLLIPIDQIRLRVERGCAAVRQVVDRSKLTPEEKRVLCRELETALRDGEA